MGRIRSPGKYVARPAWYDRNPIQRIQNWDEGAVAPHANTQRWTYTVPPGKKAFVEYAELWAKRLTAAGTVGIVEANVRVTPSGGSASAIMRVYVITNNVGDVDKAVVGQALTLLAGDMIECRSADSSTGGTATYHSAVKIVEFDA